jgi:O-antigen ligase
VCWAVATSSLLAWGALAFGGVYTWSWVPLLAGATGLGVAGVWSGLRHRTLSRDLLAAFASLVAAVLMQLLPLPARLLDFVSPGASRFLVQYDVAYALAHAGAASPTPLSDGPPHPLSIDPPLTLTGLAFVFCLGLLFLGLSAVLTRHRARRIADGVLVLGLLLACIGLAQKAAGSDLLYGFWRPYTVTDSFGPFVNKNHFGGWMLLAVPLCLGVFSERLTRAMRGVRPTWRHRVAWCSSREASGVVFSAMALVVMMASVVATLSRSALLSLAVALALLVLLVWRAESGTEPVVAVASGAVLLAITIAWVGPDAVGERFAASFHRDLAERTTAWRDAIAIVRDFPVAGTGLNTYATAALLYQSPELALRYTAAHSDYLQLAAEGGLLLTIPATAMFVVFIRLLRARWRQPEPGRWLRAGAVAGLVAIACRFPPTPPCSSS